MADEAIELLVDQIVQEHVRSGAMFTVYDVIAVARRRSGSVNHADVRDVVEELFHVGRMGTAYTRSTVDLDGEVRQLLYHPAQADPAKYRTPGGTAPRPARKPGILSWILKALFGAPSPSTAAPGGTAPGGPPAGTSWGTPNRGAPPGGSGSPSPRKPRPARTLGLDASPFLPITRDELTSAMKGTNLWSSVWFGRRDLIPPADDKRTLLIDRAMVSQGLLSPEQLVEIHRVGAEMDRVRPDVVAQRHQAAQAGQAAVDQDREARKKLKEEKKAAAAERKRQHAALVAHRKANDIIFLGRGVSGRLNDRASDPVRLAAIGLPILYTPADLAAALGLTIPQLRWLAFHAEVATRTHYVHFQVPKKSGGQRTLSAPHRRLKGVQEWVLANVLSRLPVEPPAQGFVPGRSVLTNARQHVGRKVVINMDLEGFFPSITFPRVRSVFARAGYSPAVATILALLCTECPRRTVQFDGKTCFVATGPRGLPQGACTSPALSNQVARRLDKRLAGLAAKLGLSYTRYADDLTFSGDEELQTRVGYVMARIRHIAQDEGFVVNEKKTRVLRRNAAQTVTGLVVNDRPGVARADVRRIRAILHGAKTTGLAAQNRDGHPNFPAWVDGMIAWIGMARPEVGERLRQEFNRLTSGA